MSPGALPLDVVGEQLWLLPSGAVWWPASHTLFAADLHLGKGAAFRAQGQPVPRGSSANTLGRLRAELVAQDAQRLVVLGDFWHGPAGVTAALLNEVAALVQDFDTLLVLGNHDRFAHRGDAARLPLRAELGPLALGGLWAAHEPAAAEAPGFTLAGHVHPAVWLGSRAGDQLRRPCFVHQRQGLVLPAFGSLTGSWVLRPQEYAAQGAAVAVLGADTVRWLPHSGALRSP